MQSTTTSKSDRTTEVAPPIEPAAAWRIASAEALPGLRLRVRFVDGTNGEVELESFLASEKVRGTIFEPLREPEFFSRLSVVDGTVQWPNGADLAPDAMYDAIRESGRWLVPGAER